MKRIGCFHAHHSNIEPIDRAFGGYDAEWIHFVDPGLDRIKNDPGFTAAAAEAKVLDTLAWIAQGHVDAILVTCTFFTAMLNERLLTRIPVPVFKIDEPLFREIAERKEPTLLVFTNPATVGGTMSQLNRFLAKEGKAPVELRLLPGTFELLMAGRKEVYLDQVCDGLMGIVRDNPGVTVAAAQLSMVPAAQRAMRSEGIAISHALAALADDLVRQLELKRKM